MAKANPTKRYTARRPKSRCVLIGVTTATRITADPFWRANYVSLRRKGKRELNPGVVVQEV